MDSRSPASSLQPVQQDLFAEALPVRPYATDTLGSRLLITSRSRALRRRYIQANPPWMRVFPVFDVDRPSAVLAWDDAGLPPPLWTSENRENGHAHSGWALEAPVLLGDHDRQHPMRYLCAVESCMREKLGADPSYGGLITKNPLHGHWRTYWGPPRVYSLGELAEYLPDVERHVPRRRPELVGLGRNVDTFDHLRHYAYHEIRLWWAPPRERGVYVAWLTHLYHRGLDYTANEHPTPLDHREVHHTAKSVARWVWRTFSAERFSELQAHRGRLSGERRRAATSERDARILELHAVGWSLRAIAREIGLGKSAVADVVQRVSGEPYQVEAGGSGAAAPDTL